MARARHPGPELVAPAAPAKPSMLGRVLGKLAFWRPARDTVACSVLAPPVLYAGETATLPLFAHSEPADTILAMGRTYFPAHEMVGSEPISREVARGARLTFHLAFPGLTLEPPVQKIAWRGQVMPLPFAVQVGYLATLMRFRRVQPPVLLPSTLGDLGALTGASELVFDAFLTPRGLGAWPAPEEKTA